MLINVASVDKLNFLTNIKIGALWPSTTDIKVIKSVRDQNNVS